MKYTQVNATRNGDNRIHGAIYYGVTRPETAIQMFLAELPEFKAECWNVTAKVYEDGE